MANEPEPPPSGLPVEARRRGGMDTLFSAAWFDDEKEGGDAPAEGSAAAMGRATTAVRRGPAATRAGPDPLVIAVALLACLGALGFAFVSLVMAGAVAYLWTLGG